nr:cytochrome B [Deltaproteobacteria bacterium]
MKPRVAIFDFACCEGCQLQLVNLEEALLDLASMVDVVNWREAISDRGEEYDIALVEGSITRAS